MINNQTFSADLLRLKRNSKIGLEEKDTEAIWRGMADQFFSTWSKAKKIATV